MNDNHFVQSFCHLLCMSLGFLFCLSRFITVAPELPHEFALPRLLAAGLGKKSQMMFFIVPVTHTMLKNELGFLRASFRKTLTRVIMTNTTTFGTFLYQEVYGELASHVGAVSRVHESFCLTGSFFFSFEVHWGHWHRAYRCLSSLCALNYHIWHVLKYFLLSIKCRSLYKFQILKWF